MISVCIATYNGGAFIKRQLYSILPQLGENDEVVIADDGSTDDTLPIIESLNDKRIKIIEGPHRHSPIWNFERALKAAKGDYIFLSDQDDEWMPNKVKVTLPYLKTADCVVSDNIVIDDEDHIISDSFYKLNGTRNGKFYNLLIKNGYLGCCMAFNRKVLDKSLPFPHHTPMHDIWIGNVAAFHYTVQFIPEKLIKFCRHGDNASTTAAKSEYCAWKKIKFRLNIVKDLILQSVKQRKDENACMASAK